LDILQKYRRTINNLNSQLNQKERIIEKLSNMMDGQRESSKKELEKKTKALERKNHELDKKNNLLEQEATALREEIENLKSKPPSTPVKRRRKTKND